MHNLRRELEQKISGVNEQIVRLREQQIQQTEEAVREKQPLREEEKDEFSAPAEPSISLQVHNEQLQAEKVVLQQVQQRLHELEQTNAQLVEHNMVLLRGTLQHQAQQYSRNLPLLKRVAEVCSRGAGTSSVAARALLLYSTLLHPVTVALPAVPAIDSARSFLLEAQNSAVVAPNGVSDHGNMQIGLSATETNDADAFAVNIAPSSSVKEPKSASKAKRSLAQAEVTPAKKTKADVKALSATKAPSVAPVSVTKAPTLVSASKVAKEAVKALEDDDDESLPDIDIDADPDSD